MNQLLILFLVLAVLSAIAIVVFVVLRKKKSSSPPSPSPSSSPARPTTINDCGYDDGKRGWYDMLGRGYKNDFRRTVGAGSNIWWSCAIQGADSPYSKPGEYAYIEGPRDELTSETTCAFGAK